MTSARRWSALIRTLGLTLAKLVANN